MAFVTVQLAAVNNNKSHVDLTYNDATLALTQLAWTNPEGHWTFTLIRKSDAAVFTRTLNPGDSGSIAIPNGWTWAKLKTEEPNFDFIDSWTRA
jgi:hypothetical protein